MSLLSAALNAFVEALRVINRRDELANTPEMAEAKKRAKESAAVDAETKAVVEKDVETIRENLR